MCFCTILSSLSTALVCLSLVSGACWPSGLQRRALDPDIWVRIHPTPLRNLGCFVYPTLPKSLGMLLVYPKRMALGVNPKEDFLSHAIVSLKKSLDQGIKNILYKVVIICVFLNYKTDRLTTKWCV